MQPTRPRTEPAAFNLNHRPSTVYSDFEREQSVYSFSQEYHWSQTEMGSQQSQFITAQGLQDLAMAKKNQNRGK